MLQLPHTRFELRDPTAAERVNVCFRRSSLHSVYSTPMTLKSTRVTPLMG